MWRGRFIGHALLLYLIALLSNLFLGVHEWFPHYSWGRVFIPVPEASILTSLLLLFAVYGNGRSRRLFFVLLSLSLTLLSLFSVAEALFLHFYRRPFRLLSNLHLASNFFNMLFDTEIFSRLFFLLVPSVAAVSICALLWYLLLRGETAVLRFLRLNPGGPSTASTPVHSSTPASGSVAHFVVSGALGPIFILTLLIGSSFAFSTKPYLSVRLATQLEREEELTNVGSYLSVSSHDEEAVLEAAAAEGASSRDAEAEATEVEATEVEAAAAESAVSRYGLPGFEDADIHLFIVESYGMTVFSNPHQDARLSAFYREMDGRLEDAGFMTLSSAYESTAFGGTSWLADASLITGLRIDTQHKYDRIMEEGTGNLLHILEDKGYSRVLSAPGTSYMDEKYQRFYDFTRYLLYEDFEYEGPYFSYGRMPDQYQLARAARELGLSEQEASTELSEVSLQEAEESVYGAESTREEKPLFVEYMLCSSHVPWNYIPPYLQNWNYPSNGRVYYDRSRNTYYDTSWIAGSESFEGYAHSIRYSLESAFGYIMRLLRDGEVVLLVGDHQPAFPVSEKGASFAVPIHILSTEGEKINPFLRFGYVEGLRPPAGENFPGIERFLSHFMSVAEGG